MTTDPRPPVLCPAFRDALQAYLDGATDTLPAGGDEHRSSCAACRAEFQAAVALRNQFRVRREIEVPAALVARIEAAVYADAVAVDRQRRLTRGLVLVLAIAACLLLAVAIGQQFWRTEQATTAPEGSAAVAVNQKAGGISVDESIANAGDALASLARRSTSPAIEPAKLIPAAPPIGLSDPLPDPTQPAAQSLAEIRQGASSGFEPLGRTARRAINLFIRDIPVQADNKPGS